MKHAIRSREFRDHTVCRLRVNERPTYIADHATRAFQLCNAHMWIMRVAREFALADIV